MNPQGIMRFLDDLGVSPEDVCFEMLINAQPKVLVMAYYMKASVPGYFTREEFTNGLGELKFVVFVYF